MASIGYARVSTVDQDLTTQLDALQNAGCEPIRAEKVSGRSREGREELQSILAFIRNDDELVVTRFDRLGRSLRDLLDIVEQLETKGATLRVLDHSINTKGATGRMFLQLLGAFSQFEADIRKERQLEGIAKAKARGVYKGRKTSIDRDKVRELKARGVGVSAIARQLGISRQSVYRLTEGGAR